MRTLKLSKLNILVAFPYFKGDIIKMLSEVPRDSFELIVDSGAFTAWNTGREIKLDDYCTFLDTISHLRPFHAVQLDVFGDPEASWHNFKIMKERGYDVMPVFTRGETLDRLEEMYAEKDYIMFGGVTIGRGNKEYVKWFLERNKGRMAHWLGFVNMPFIKHYRPTSVDSSSWKSAGRFGNVSFYMGSGVLKTFNKMLFVNPPTAQMVACAKRVGLKAEDLRILRFKEAWVANASHDGNLDENKEDKRTSAYFIDALAHVVRSWEVEKKLGTKIYLAVSNCQELRLLYTAKKFLNERGIQ